MKTTNEDSVTFYLESAALKFNLDIYQKLDVNLAWDVYFEFRTGVSKSTGTLFHAYSEFDEILISITNGFFITVELNSKEVLSYQSLSKLDDNQWHSVLLEWNIKEITLFVDKKNATLLSFKNSIGHYRPLVLKHAVIGANHDFTNGYLGCLRSLWLNGLKIDTSKLKNKSKGSKGIKFGGCNGACDTLPCKHGGLCQENYLNFSCDCSQSAYKGPTCQEEVSFNFNGSTIQTNLSSLPTIEDINVIFSFVATFEDYEESATLLTLSTDTDSELSIQLQPSGGLSIDITDEDTDDLNVENLDMSALHEIGIKTLDHGKILLLKLNYQETKSIPLQNTTLENKFWTVAEFGTDYVGCMSNIIINYKIAPLKGSPDAFSGTCRASKLTRDANEEDYISTTTEIIEDQETTYYTFNDTTEMLPQLMISTMRFTNWRRIMVIRT